MTPAICNVGVCPHHFQMPSFSSKINEGLLRDNSDVIVKRGHLTRRFIDKASLLRLLGYSTSTQGVFEIQVKIFNPPSVGIARNLLLKNEDIKEYKIQVPPSMLFANEDIKEYKIQVPPSMTLLQNAPF